MLVLVTGATGKVGRHFIERFLSEPAYGASRVRALCHNRLLEAGERLEAVSGDISVPGGHALRDPPQQLHRKPSIPQYRQYSHVDGSPGSSGLPVVCGGTSLGPPPWLAARATGSSGIEAAPARLVANNPMKPRRELR